MDGSSAPRASTIWPSRRPGAPRERAAVFDRTSRGLAAATVLLAGWLTAVHPASGPDPVVLTATAVSVPTVSTSPGLPFLAPGRSVERLEAAAIQLAVDLEAVPGSFEDGAGPCARERLRVSWQAPVGYLSGSYLEPVGPRPGPATVDVNGVVVCAGSRAGFMGFEAHREGAGWRLYPVPTSESWHPPIDPSVPGPSTGGGDAAGVPSAPAFGLDELPAGGLGPIDPYARYEPQRTCDPFPKPGATLLATLLLDAVPGTTHLGVTRSCDRGPRSEHKEGRAFDWGVGPGQVAAVEEALALLLATDQDGHRHALARRMGIMYIIWDGTIWASYRPDDGWRPYRGPDPHHDHVHVSLSWDGALARTSLWRASGSTSRLEAAGSLTTETAPPRRSPSAATPVTSAPPRPTIARSPATTSSGATSSSGSRPPSPTSPPTGSRSPSTPDPGRTDPPDPGTTEPATPPVATARILVRFAPETATSARTAVRDTAAGELLRTITAVPGLEIWQVPDDDVDARLVALRDEPSIRYAERDRAIVAAAEEIDPAGPSEEAGGDPPDPVTEVATDEPADPSADTVAGGASDADPVSSASDPNPPVAPTDDAGTDEPAADPTDAGATPAANDPLLAEQWGLIAEHGIRAPAAWEVTTGSREVVVALLDSGIDRSHPDLAANVWTNPSEIADNGRDDDGNGHVDDVHGWDYCSDEPDPVDDHGHGTHVAGIVGAVGDDGTGIAGVAWQVRLLPLKVLCADGTGRLSDAVAALDDTLAAGIPISNNSWSWSGAPSEAMADTIAAAASAGHLFVAAAGAQSSAGATYPAAYGHANVIAVAATDGAGALWSGSNRGSKVHLGAPGTGVVSTAPGGGYTSATGTSAAAAHVSGAAALLRSVDPQRTGQALRDRLLASVRPLPGLGGMVTSGGLLDAGAALGRASDPSTGSP
jgi:subtilisin family serine protease